MSAEAANPEAGGQPAARKGGRKKLLLLALPVVLAAVGAGLWFSGLLAPLLGGEHAAETAEAVAPSVSQPAFVDLPDIVSNLNAPGRRASFVRVKAKLEVARPEDVAAVQAAMPRLLDLFSTYLREVRPEELRGSAGSHRLREELIARATIAIAPEARGERPAPEARGERPAPEARAERPSPRVTDVLFTEILVQ